MSIFVKEFNFQMPMEDRIQIRPIEASDNNAIASIIRETLLEFDAPTDGTAYSDPETLSMYEAYQNERSLYLVAELNGEVVAGCGINRLKDAEADTCELQKMYMKPKARGKKIGKRLILASLEFAKNTGYKKCYLETFPNMTAAIRLYEKNGFRRINAPMGNTCHYACNVWMLKEL